MIPCTLALWTVLSGQLLPATPSGFIGADSPLPAFELESADGERLSSENLRGKPSVVIFLRPGQRNSLAALRELAHLRRELAARPWRWIGICSGEVSAEAVRGLKGATGFPGTLLLDPERAAYAAFGVVALPSLAVIDRDLRVVYSRPGWGKGVVPEVREHLRRALGMAPREKAAPVPRSAAKIALARALIRKNQLDQAASLLRDAIADEPTPEAYVELGEIHLRRGEPERALLLLRKARKMERQVPDVDIAIGRALADLRQYDEAESLFRDVGLRHPDSWQAHLELGRIYEKTERKDLALAEYRRAIAILARQTGAVQRRRGSSR